ncbi:hypothetical protein D9757_011410 [Collybiopsis confluens]|uniref:Uncharacterized protein n=1 Tax=Collybiopsis confluens TaxID=2823264 RepID=A0A8H5G8C8_9AGAR|nr:hypothetical protein D9757_014307 [Collybiopsis confluens]KAF5360214.1 hypothetical protein D9757_011410 [Collybiopsis confluens]
MKDPESGQSPCANTPAKPGAYSLQLLSLHAGDAIVVVFGVSMTSTHQSMYLHHFYSQICGVLVVPSTGGVHVATTASGCAIGEWFCDNSKQIGSGYLAPLLSLRQMGDNSNVCPLAHTSVTIPRYLYDH